MEKTERLDAAGARRADPKPLSVVIVDDHPVVRDGLCAMVSADPNIQIVAQVGTGAEALTAIQQHRPMVVLMDLLLPDINGWEVIKRVCANSSDTAFLVLTTLVGDEEIYRAIEAGARGYLFKDMARKELILAIHAVASGKRYIPAEVGTRIAESLPRTALTSREVDVLQAIAAGLRNKEISHHLGISESTINAHVKHILEKLHASDRTQAVTTALRRGIIRL
jgi:two-component system, NarL family, response regulator